MATKQVHANYYFHQTYHSLIRQAYNRCRNYFLLIQFGKDFFHVDTANGIIKAASGHHHILVDAAGPMASGIVIPKDSVHLHFGNAQTSAEIKLPAGKHTLTLQFADGLHRSYGDKLSSTVTVNVKN